MLARAGLKSWWLRLQLTVDEKEKILKAWIKVKFKQKSLKITFFYSSEEGGVFLKIF